MANSLANVSSANLAIQTSSSPLNGSVRKAAMPATALVAKAVGIQVPQALHTVSPDMAAQANKYLLPNSFSVTIKNTGTTQTQAFIFNQDMLTAANSNCVYTYQTGIYGDKLISELLNRARAGVGAIVHGCAISAYLSGNTADSVGASLTYPSFYDYNAFGTNEPTPFLTDNITRSDFSDNIYVLSFTKNVSRFTQFGVYVQPNGGSVQLIFYLDPYFKK